MQYATYNYVCVNIHGYGINYSHYNYDVRQNRLLQKCSDVVKPATTYNHIHMNHLTSMYIVGICFHIYCNYWFDKPLQIMGR